MSIKDSTVIKIKKLNLAIEKYSNGQLAKYDLTHPQFSVIKVLYNSSRASMRQVDIEMMLSLSNPTVTRLIQQLEKKEMILKVINPEDSRSKLISLTQKAIQLKEELIDYADALERHVTEKLTPIETEQLNELLGKLQG